MLNVALNIHSTLLAKAPFPTERSGRLNEAEPRPAMLAG